MVLGAASLLISGETDTFTRIEQAELTGGPTANTLNAQAFLGPVNFDSGGGLDTLLGPTGGSGDTQYRVDVSGLTAPTSASDTAHQVNINVGSRPAKIIIDGSGSSVTQSDLWWVNLTGTANAAADYELRETNASLDVGHRNDDTLTVSEDLVFHGRNITLEAGTVNIIGHTLDTSSNLNGGNIAITAKHVTIDGGSLLDARTTSSGGLTTSGTISLLASENRAQITALGFANVDLLDTDLNIGAATIRGGDVVITGEADSRFILHESDFGENSIAQLLGGSVLGGILKAIEGLSVIAGVAYSRSTTHINLGTSATTPTVIDADQLTVGTTAAVAVSAAPIGLNFAFGVGIAKTEAVIDIGNAAITTTGDVIVQSKGDHTVDVRGDASNGPITRLFAVGVGVSVLDSTVTASIGPQAHLTVGRDLYVQAETIDRNSTFGRVTVDPAGAFGAAVAVSVEHGDTTASIDGHADVTRNVNVTAKQSKAPVEANRTFVIPSYYTGVASSAGVGTSSTGTFLDDLKSSITAAIKPKVIGGLKSIGNAILTLGKAIYDKVRGGPTFGPENKPKEPKTPETEINRKSVQGAIGVTVVEDTTNVAARIGD